MKSIKSLFNQDCLAGVLALITCVTGCDAIFQQQKLQAIVHILDSVEF